MEQDLTLTAEDWVEFWNSPSRSVLEKRMEKEPKIELETDVKHNVIAIVETEYFYGGFAYSGWLTYEHADAAIEALVKQE